MLIHIDIKTLMKTPDKILKFYQSVEWKRVRRLKRQISKGICEQCGNAGWEVHHKIPLTLTNINNPEISMGLNNLELLCTSCHNAKRATEAEIRSDICFDSQGNVHCKHPPGSNIQIDPIENNGSLLQ